MIDLHHIPERHQAIDERLHEWAAWVKDRPNAWKTQPMFRMFRSLARQWHAPEPKREINTLQAHEVERAVCLLPDPYRAVIRWAYVFAYIPDNAVRRQHGLTRAALAETLDKGRDMVKNRIAQKLRETNVITDVDGNETRLYYPEGMAKPKYEWKS